MQSNSETWRSCRGNEAVEIDSPIAPLLRLANLAVFSAALALGAVADNVAANVRDFGAKGDGQTDDTEAIRQAIAAVPPHGGVVYLAKRRDK